MLEAQLMYPLLGNWSLLAMSCVQWPVSFKLLSKFSPTSLV